MEARRVTPASMSIESLADLKVPRLPDGHPEPLGALMADLREALRHDDPFDAAEAVRRMLEFLLRYYTGVATGLLSKLDPARPEVEALASNMDSLVHYERLLRFSLSALEARPDHPAQISLRRVFFEDGRQTAPLIHTRWLRLAGPTEPELLELSAWAGNLARLRAANDLTGCRAEVRRFLDVLRHWLDASATFFGSWRHRYRPAGGDRATLQALESRECTFDLLPVVEVAGPPPPRSLSLTLSLPKTETRAPWPPQDPPTDDLPEPEFLLPDPIDFEEDAFPPPPMTEEELPLPPPMRPGNGPSPRVIPPPGEGPLVRPTREVFADFLDFSGISTNWSPEDAGERLLGIVDHVGVTAELLPAFLKSSGILSRLERSVHDLDERYQAALALESFLEHTGLIDQALAAQEAVLKPSPPPPSEEPPDIVPTSPPRESPTVLRPHTRILEPPPARREVPDIGPPPITEEEEGSGPGPPPMTEEEHSPPRQISLRRQKKIALPSKAFLERGPRRRGAAPWTAQEQDTFEDLLAERYPPLPPELVPTHLVEPVAAYVGERNQGYVLVRGDQGTGKSLLCTALEGRLRTRSGETLPVVTFAVKRLLSCDSETFIELLNEFIERRGRGLRGLEYHVTHNLCVRFAGEPLDARFAAFLSELTLVNDSGLVLVLDGLEEAFEGGSDVSLADFLPSRLPTGVFLVLSYRPEGISARTRARLFELEQAQARVVEISTEDPAYAALLERLLNHLEPRDRPWTDEVRERILGQARGRLAAVSMLGNMVASGLVRFLRDLPPAEHLYATLFEALERRFGDRFLYLFLLLATSDEPVPVEELSTFGIRREDADELVHNLPSLFRCPDGDDPGLILAHQSIRHYLQEAYSSSYAKVCQRLARFAMDELCELEDVLRAARERLEAMEQTLGRLYSWALDAQDHELLAEVCRTDEVEAAREATFAQLEDRGRLHRKATILDTYRECLATLVERYGRNDFREKLAWAHSSRGLAFANLGHFQAALADTDRAIHHFLILVQEEKREELRNGLAAAFNRRAETYRQLGQTGSAAEDAQQAVIHYTTVVEGQGRKDLRDLLALAIHNRGLIERLRGDQQRAHDDFDKAIDLYSRLVEVEKQKTQMRALAQAHHSRSALLTDEGELEMAVHDASEAVRLLHHLVEEQGQDQLRNELAAALNDRGAAQHRLGRLAPAHDDYTAAIAIRTHLVTQGRLDVRTDLARTLTNTGLVLTAGEQLEDAERCHRAALEILDRLVEEEGRRDLYEIRGFARMCQADLFRRQGELVVAREDYTRAVLDFEKGARRQPALNVELARALSSLGLVCLDLGELEKAVESQTRALELFHQDPGGEGRTYDMALAYTNRCEALCRLEDLAGAREDSAHTVRLYTLLVQEEGRVDLAGDLANSHLRQARLAEQTGDTETCVRDASRAIALFGNLVAEQQRSEHRGPLADTLDLRARAYLSLSSLDQSLDDASSAAEAFQELFDQEPSVELEVKLARALELRAKVMVKMGACSEALEDFARAAEHYRRLEESDPASGWERARAAALLSRAQANLDADQVAAAVRDVVEAFSSGRLTGDPACMEQVRHLVKTLKLRSLRLLRERALEQAVELSGELIGLLSALGVQDNLEFQAELAQGYHYRGWARTHLREVKAARADFDNALAVYEPLVLDRGLEEHVEMLARTYTSRAATLDALGFEEGALQDYDRAVEQFSKLESVSARELLAAAHTSRGQLRRRTQDLAGSAEDFDAAVTLHRSFQDENRLAAVLVERGETLRDLGRRDRARADLQEAASLYGAMAQVDPDRYTGELVRCLVTRSGLSEGDLAADPGAVDALIQAARTLTAAARRGSLPSGFDDLPGSFFEQTLELVEKNQLQDADTLLESVLDLGEVLLDHTTAGNQWVAYPNLLLKIGTHLPELEQEHRQAHFMALAAAYCRREVEIYGERSLARLVRCLHLLGRALTRGQVPAFLERVGPCFDLLARHLATYQPGRELEVEINNTARIWQALPASIPARAKVSRTRLNEIRRW